MFCAFAIALHASVTANGEKYKFNGGGGGLAVGGGDSWGSVWLNYPLEEGLIARE